MGGLLIADSVLRMQAHKQHPAELLWPRIIAVIAFDTPVSLDIIIVLCCIERLTLIFELSISAYTHMSL